MTIRIAPQRFRFSLLISLGTALLLSACASPGTRDARSAAADDPIHRHALVRQASPTPDWGRLRELLSTATESLPGITVGAADTQGFRIEIPVADGFASGSTVIRPSSPQRSTRLPRSSPGSPASPSSSSATLTARAAKW